MKLGAKIAIGICAGIVGLAAIGIGTIYGVWFNEINSIISIKEVIPTHEDNKAGPVYEMSVQGDYYFDDFLAQGGASNDQELINFIVKNITKGVIPIKMNAPEIGCSSFTVVDENNNNLFGRNYDFSTTTSMILHTNPGNGRHASISSVDLQFLGISGEMTSLIQKATALAAAYAPLDGMNDAGVACGIYMSYQGPEDNVTSTNQNSDKPDLTSTTMLRMILDYADSVDEAVELVKQYDFHDSANTSFHYMIADKSGKSAILEWVDKTDSTDIDGTTRELKVYYNDDDSVVGEDEGRDNFQYITNFIVTPNYYENDSDKKGLDRYNFIKESINPDGNNTQGKYSKEEALNLLKTLGRRSWDKEHGLSDSNSITVWSSLYDLDNLSVTWVSNEEFDNSSSVFTFSLK